MTSRALAIMALTCALLLGAPTTLADGDDDPLPTLSTDDLFSPGDIPDPNDGCISQLRATFVSFAGDIVDTDYEDVDLAASVLGEARTHVETFVTSIISVYAFLPLSGLELVDTIEEVEKVVTSTSESYRQDYGVHAEWKEELVVWERIERTIAVPVPADANMYDESDVVSSCDDHGLSIEFPYHGSGYDYYDNSWYPEQFAPETPDPEVFIDILDIEIVEGLSPGTKYDDYASGYSFCPQPVMDELDRQLDTLDPVTEEVVTLFETVHSAIMESDLEEEGEEDAEAEEEPQFEEGEDSEDALAPMIAAFQAMPLAAKAGAGGALGIMGLLGSILALRRR